MAKTKYMTSKETMKALKITSCELMHLRTSGALKFIKKGNSFMYEGEIVDNMKI